ncbi:cytochrome P450 [Suillus subalutaceus]|uniref:cytochrome P450 n=1 Tax=Suillus subalutaceus TaxID=48586 RepID=UPI001B8659F1|nr:cytochrome P450 [Suillus subalutaceus]KAG1845716.1 cytochrome P450 [Suillus subalutaceus]
MLQFPNLPIYDKTQLILNAAACVGVIGVVVWAYLRKSDSRLPLPPSPPTWRLRGHFLPPNNASSTVMRWIDEYGPSDYNSLRNPDRRNYRPLQSCGGYNGEAGALHTHLQPKSAEAYQPLQISQAKTMILSILDDPCNFQNHVTTYATTAIMKIAYGKTIPTLATDPKIREARQLIRRLNPILHHGYYLVDLIPWLKYLPWYAPELKDEFKRTKRLFTDQLNRVKLQMQSNEDIGPSFSKYILENGHLYGLTETEMAYLAGSFFGAGIKTTAVAISMVELDAVIGREQAPTFADKTSLPHLEAFISEALRWRPVTPEGFPHRTTEDENYCIPAGTTVTGNHWAISRDPEVYPEPDAFKPQRWINDQGCLRDDLTFFVFGFGRCVCPGQHVANRSVFINLLLILWAFQLSLDPTKLQDDMGFTNVMMLNDPCTIEFQTRVPEAELRRMMQNHPESG